MSGRKGRTLGLGEFLGGFSGPAAGPAIPTAPQPREDRDRFRENRRVHDEEPTEADFADNWRSGGALPQQQDAPPSVLGTSVPEGVNWRDAAPAAGAEPDDDSDSRGGFRADADTNWRRVEASAGDDAAGDDGRGAGGPPRADVATNWRAAESAADDADREPAAEPYVNRADEDHDWRGKPAVEPPQEDQGRTSPKDWGELRSRGAAAADQDDAPPAGGRWGGRGRGGRFGARDAAEDGGDGDGDGRFKFGGRGRFGGGRGDSEDGGDRPRFGASRFGGGRGDSEDGGDRPRFGASRFGGGRRDDDTSGDRPRFGGSRFGGGRGDSEDGGDRPRFGAGRRDGGGAFGSSRRDDDAGDRPRFGAGRRDGGGAFGSSRRDDDDSGDRPRFGAGRRDGSAAFGSSRRDDDDGGDRPAPRFGAGRRDGSAAFGSSRRDDDGGERPRFGRRDGGGAFGGGGGRDRDGGGAFGGGGRDRDGGGAFGGGGGGAFGGGRDRDRDGGGAFGGGGGRFGRDRDRDGGGAFGGGRDRDRDGGGAFGGGGGRFGSGRDGPSGRFGGGRGGGRSGIFDGQRQLPSAPGAYVPPAARMAAAAGAGGGAGAGAGVRGHSGDAAAPGAAPKQEQSQKSLARGASKDATLARATFRHNVDRVVSDYIADVSLSAAETALMAIAEMEVPDFHAEVIAAIVGRVVATDERAVFNMLVALAAASCKPFTAKGKGKKKGKTKPRLVTDAQLMDGLESLPADASGEPLTRYCDLVSALVSKDVVDMDALSPAIKDHLAGAGVGDESKVDDTPEGIAVAVLDGGALGKDLAVAMFEALKTVDKKAAAAAVAKAVLGKVAPLTKKAPWTAPDQYGLALAVFMQEKEAAVGGLNAIQAALHAQGFPKGVIEAVFHHLYDNDVVADDAFLEWKDDVDDDVPGKLDALRQLNRWLEWLEESDDDSDDDDDDDE